MAAETNLCIPYVTGCVPGIDWQASLSLLIVRRLSPHCRRTRAPQPFSLSLIYEMQKACRTRCALPGARLSVVSLGYAVSCSTGGPALVNGLAGAVPAGVV